MKGKKYTKLHEWRERAKSADLPCEKCGRVGFMNLDHIVPAFFIDMLGLTQQSYDDEWNYQFLCRACNILKSSRFDPTHPKSFENMRRYITKAEEWYGISH